MGKHTRSRPERSQSPLQCDGCDAPLTLDESLLRLNRAQLSLLVSKTPQTQEEEPVDLSEYLPHDRLETLREATAVAGLKPVYYRNLIELESDDDDTSDHTTSGIQTAGSSAASLNGLDASFVMLLEDSAPDGSGKPGANHNDSISKRIHLLTQVFQILLSTGEINHPLLEDCAELLVENYKNKFDQSQREKEHYTAFLRKLEEKSQVTAADVPESNLGPLLAAPSALDIKLGEARSQLQAQAKEQAAKLEELAELEKQKRELQQQLDALTAEMYEVEQTQVEQALVQRNLEGLRRRQEDHRLAQVQLVYQSRLDHLDRLRRLNIYQEIFNITFVDGYGSINGYRLGYRIVWLEVNAALGQIVLLLVFLIKRLGVDLQGYKLVPIGLKSQIVKYGAKPAEDEAQSVAGLVHSGTNGILGSIPNPRGATAATTGGRTKTVLNLYSSNEFSLGRLFNFNKLDVLMIALVEIVMQIEKAVHAVDADIELPYKMQATGVVGGKLVRVTSNAEWTEGCKHLLINLNWILTWVKSRG